MHEFEAHEAPAPAWRGWLGDALRSAAFLRPRAVGLVAGPALVAGLLLAGLALGVGLQRLMVPGAARFYPEGLAAGWLPTLLIAWACWLATRHAPAIGSADGRASRLFALILLKDLLLGLVVGLALVALVRGEPGGEAPSQRWVWGLYLAGMAWMLLSGLLLLWRESAAPLRARLALVPAFALVAVVQTWGPGIGYWSPQPEAVAETGDEGQPLRLTQATLEAQSAAVVQQLGALAPERPGVVDLYAIGFAPYADEDVFSRETAMVAEVMSERFDAAGRVIRMQNHAKTVAELPWATPLNLERAIHAAAAKMNLDEDVLFLHLTSHGARDGQLAADFWPLEVDAVTPQQLRAWLDAAGVRHRVVSVSACYSGSWIAPLAEPGTLVMTAADATHTSYGCGRLSPLTFFGRAVFDEQLRTHTLSFEQAHATARKVIDEREKAAGKTDGYSNPQIAVGAAIRPVLDALQARLAAAAAR